MTALTGDLFVYKETDDFIRKAHTHGVSQEDILDFRTVTKEAYFLFDETLGSYLEHEILAKGQEIWSMTGKDVDPVEDTRKRRELKDWMRDQRIHARKKFATFLRSSDGSWLSALRCFCRPDRWSLVIQTPAAKRLLVAGPGRTERRSGRAGAGGPGVRGTPRKPNEPESLRYFNG